MSNGSVERPIGIAITGSIRHNESIEVREDNESESGMSANRSLMRKMLRGGSKTIEKDK